MWCDLWWPQWFQLLDFLSPCLQHRPLKARAAILCSAACIHTQGHQEKKRWRGDKREGEGPVWPRSSQVSPFVHSQNTAGSPSTSLCPCCLFHSSFPSSIFSLLALSFSNTEQLPRVTITKQPLSYFLRSFYTELKIENGIAGRSQGDRSLQDGMIWQTHVMTRWRSLVSDCMHHYLVVHLRSTMITSKTLCIMLMVRYITLHFVRFLCNNYNTIVSLKVA